MGFLSERDKSRLGIFGARILHNDLFTDFIVSASHFRNPGQRSSSSIRIWEVRGVLSQFGQGIRSCLGRVWPQPEQMMGKGFMAFTFQIPPRTSFVYKVHHSYHKVKTKSNGAPNLRHFSVFLMEGVFWLVGLIIGGWRSDLHPPPMRVWGLGDTNHICIFTWKSLMK